MKVDFPPAKSSDAPILVKILSEIEMKKKACGLSIAWENEK